MSIDTIGPTIGFVPAVSTVILYVLAMVCAYLLRHTLKKGE